MGKGVVFSQLPLNESAQYDNVPAVIYKATSVRACHFLMSGDKRVHKNTLNNLWL